MSQKSMFTYVVEIHGKTFDFRFAKPLKNIARLFIEDFREWATSCRPSSVAVKALHLRRFLSFLLAQKRNQMDVGLDQATLSLYAEYLDQITDARGKKLHVITQAHNYNGIVFHLRRLADAGTIKKFRTSTHFHGAKAFSSPRKTLNELLKHKKKQEQYSTKQLLRLVYDHAWQEINTTWRKYKATQLLLQKARLRVDAPDWKDLGWVLAYIEKYLNGITISQTCSYTKPYANIPHIIQYRRAIIYQKGAKALAGYLYLDLRTLAPFAVIFAGAHLTPCAIADLNIEDLKATDNPRSKLLTWLKYRSGGELDGAAFRIGMGNAPTIPRAFQKLQELTNLTRTLLGTAKHATRLFLARSSKNKTPISHSPNGASLGIGIMEFKKRFSKAHPELGSFPFSLVNIRASALNQFHQDTGRVLQLTSLAANHKHATTTAGYVNHPEHRTFLAEQIRNAQNSMVLWMRKGKPQMVTPNPFPSHQSLEAAELNTGPDTTNNSYFAVGQGLSCRDPLDSPIPGQKKGKLCDFYLGCWACPNSIVIATPFNYARVMLWKRHLERAAPQLTTLNLLRWTTLYAPQLTMLTESLRDFPRDVVLEAERLWGGTLLPKLTIAFPPVR